MRDLTVNEIEEVNGGVGFYDVWPLPWMRPIFTANPTKKIKTGGGGFYSQYAEYYSDLYS
jgi:hypothetical protein